MTVQQIFKMIDENTKEYQKGLEKLHPILKVKYGEKLDNVFLDPLNGVVYTRDKNDNRHEKYLVDTKGRIYKFPEAELEDEIIKIGCKMIDKILKGE